MTKHEEELTDMYILECLYHLRAEIQMHIVLPNEDRKKYINAEYERLFGVES